MADDRTVKQLLAQIVDAREDEQKELKATRAHLEDLREILFRFDWVEIQRGEPTRLLKEE